MCSVLYNKNDCKFLRKKALKELTSLTIASQKNIINSQMNENSRFIKQARIKEILEFLRASDFVLGLRFFETPTFSRADLLSVISPFSVDIVSIRGFKECSALLVELGELDLELTKLLVSSNSIFFLRAPSSDALTGLVKALIAAEENPNSGAMLGLCFVREHNSLFDLRMGLSGGESARSFYKTYDSRESILLELLNLEFSVLRALTTALEVEVETAAEYGVAEAKASSWFFS